jgi:hypothetical protein
MKRVKGEERRRKSGRIAAVGVAACLASFLGCSGNLHIYGSDRGISTGCREAYAATRDDKAAAAAFLKASKVLLHPRCVNCHPAGDRPLVGDQSRPHPMQVERGPQGVGNNGLLCSTCHREKNQPGAHIPPGAPEWQLPTPEMPMVFEKRSPGQLCEQLKDPVRNGWRSPNEVVEHVREAPLVLWGWHPGDGRTPVSMPHAEFVGLMAEWADKGAACP